MTERCWTVWTYPAGLYNFKIEYCLRTQNLQSLTFINPFKKLCFFFCFTLKIYDYKSYNEIPRYKSWLEKNNTESNNYN